MFVRRILVHPIRPIGYCAVIFLICKPRRYGRLRFGGCTFYGPPFFLDLCKAACERLTEIDPELAQGFRSGFLFWYDPVKLEQVEKLFSISDDYCVWKEQGIIAFLVYAFYKSECFAGRVFSRRQKMEAQRLATLAHEKTSAWLKAHSFASELVQTFI